MSTRGRAALPFPSRAKRVTSAAAVCALAAVSCGGRDGPPRSSGGPSGQGDVQVERRGVVEQTPNGTRETVITTRTTTQTVPAPLAAPRPADPYPADPLVKYNVDLLNQYRARAGVAPLVYDARVSAFALEGSRQLAADHRAHAHFAASPAYAGHTAENQGDPNGVPPMGSDRTSSGRQQIALLLKLMFDEGPGGGHHDNMLNPVYRRVGIGIFYTPAGALYLTNDFSD